MRKRVVWCLCGILASLAVVSAVPPEPEPLPAIAAAVAVPIELGQESECDTNCYHCYDGSHYAVGVEPGDGDYARNDGWHDYPDCRQGSCANTHGCGVTLAAGLDELIRSLQQQEIRGIRAALGSLGDQVAVNASRSAIQVTGCNGKLWAHLPVSANLVQALAEAE